MFLIKTCENTYKQPICIYFLKNYQNLIKNKLKNNFILYYLTFIDITSFGVREKRAS